MENIKKIKKAIRSEFRNRAAFRQGTIEAVNDDGTYSVTLKGRPFPLMAISNLFDTTFSVGQGVTVVMLENDQRKAQIVGKAGYMQ